MPNKFYNNKAILAVLSLMLGLATVFWFVEKRAAVLGICYPLAISVFIAYLLNQPVKYLESRIGSRLNSVVIVFTATMLITLAIVFFTVPVLINDLADMVSNLPAQMSEFRSGIDKVNQLVAKISPEYGDLSYLILAKASEYWQTMLWRIFISLTSDIEGLLKKISILVYIPILIFFILKDFEEMKKAIKFNLTSQVVHEISFLKRKINLIIFGWLKGQVIVCSIIGLLVYIGLSFIGLNQRFFLAIFSGVTNLIPYFGPILGALPAVATAFTQDSSMVIKVILLYTLIQQIEGNIISPQVFGDRVGLSPAWILVALIVGGKVGGILGLILAVPLAGVVKAVLEYWGGRKIRYIEEELS